MPSLESFGFINFKTNNNVQSESMRNQFIGYNSVHPLSWLASMGNPNFSTTFSNSFSHFERNDSEPKPGNLFRKMKSFNQSTQSQTTILGDPSEFSKRESFQAPFRLKEESTHMGSPRAVIPSRRDQRNNDASGKSRGMQLFRLFPHQFKVP